MKSKHYIYIPFSGVGLHGGYRGDEWFAHRIEVFKRFTLNSLVNQTNKDFTIWCSFRPEEWSNPLTSKIGKAIQDAGLSYVFTFEGLMYHDDKFTTFTVKTVVRNMLMMLMDCWRNKKLRSPIEIIKYSFQNKNKTLLSRLMVSLYHLTNNGADWVYLTRIDSDDMFHEDVVQMIQDQEPAVKKALVFKNGVVYNVATGQLAEWNPKTNPPFHTIIFPGETFYDAQLHKDYYGTFKSHESITQEFNCTVLPDKHYCQVVNHGKRGNISTYWEAQPMYLVTTGHNTNIGTFWNTSFIGRLYNKCKSPKVKTGAIHPFIGNEFHGQEKQDILKGFGL